MMFSKTKTQSSAVVKDTENLSVTLTLSSQAAQDIVSVLKNLANVLNIPPPASYKITERIPTPNKINPFGDKSENNVEESTSAFTKFFTISIDWILI